MGEGCSTTSSRATEERESEKESERESERERERFQPVPEKNESRKELCVGNMTSDTAGNKKISPWVLLPFPQVLVAV